MRKFLDDFLKNPFLILASFFGVLAFAGLGPLTKLSFLKQSEGVDVLSIEHNEYTGSRTWELAICDDGEPLEEVVLQVLADGATEVRADIDGTSATLRRGKGIGHEGRYTFDPSADEAMAQAKGMPFRPVRATVRKGACITLRVTFAAGKVPSEPWASVQAKTLRPTNTDMLKGATMARRLAGLFALIFMVVALATTSRSKPEGDR